MNRKEHRLLMRQIHRSQKKALLSSATKSDIRVRHPLPSLNMLFVDKDTQEFAATTETISFPSEEYTEGIEKRLLLFDPEDSADVFSEGRASR